MCSMSLNAGSILYFDFSASRDDHLKSQAYNIKAQRDFVTLIREGPPVRDFGNIILCNKVTFIVLESSSLGIYSH